MTAPVPMPRAGRVVVASDSFKGSLTSAQVGAAVRAGILDVVPDAVVTVVPVADGGEGTVAAALATGYEPVAATVHGPTGELHTTTLAWHQGAGTAVVELADACGLGRLAGGVAAPLTASSRGLGDALRAALGLGPRLLVVGVGGSASTDGGAGMLSALGARVLDDAGAEVPDGGAALERVARLDPSALDPRLRAVDLVLAADVTNPLLGPRGAAAVFGPQKGAGPGDVRRLEAGLATWAEVVGGGWAEQPGAGAAGGVGFALMAVLGAQRRPGVDVVLDLASADDLLAGADLVVTGEGSLDGQTASGKAVAGVARRARAAGVPVVAVCGRNRLSDSETHGLGLDVAYALSDLEPDPARSMADAAALLRLVGARIAREGLSRAPG
ncbi:glycerate kinase [Phycicoccus duodecadis]|uniref:Glycerate kinase n=1 Tax=Phycicoccus duodecadis TaxID=173053 RepID=A0A2N3YLM2_9MICO|nr:glycerate kinase [Phycicoccus duodecadis]PKW27755.1 glycerate kinase [Phycicoccus duodecadis]